MAAEVLKWSMFSKDARHGAARAAEATEAGKEIDCGWIPPHKRTPAQNRIDEEIRKSLPRFTLRGRFAADKRRYCLWKAHVTLTGKFHRYNWQQTGSCVGAGGDNALKTLQAVEIVLKGERERMLDNWWLYAYGRSRHHAGMRGQGEGSVGSAWAKAINTDGFFEIDPDGEPDLPDYQDREDWIVQPSRTEMQWSDGGRIAENWLRLGRKRRVKTVSRIRNKDEAFEAVANGYPLTQASNFGFSRPKVKGTKNPIRVAEWNGKWSHQTFIDEAWDHEELSGIYFHWGNNWGPDAHGPPTGDEPPGGVYIHESIVDRLCKEGEVYALSDQDGYPARELNWSMFS